MNTLKKCRYSFFSDSDPLPPKGESLKNSHIKVPFGDLGVGNKHLHKFILMFRTFVILACLLAISATVLAQYRLDIEISGFRNDKGVVMLQLLDTFQLVVAEKMEAISGGKCSLTMGELRAGKYALRYFHDENLSGKMDTNRFGKPTEGYGFSNNASGIFGPPPFKKWIFEVTADKKINLEIVY
jgi:uncharacterized protein (DUF2141 family)